MDSLLSKPNKSTEIMMDFQSPSPLPTCLKKPLNRKKQNGQLREHSVTLKIFNYLLLALRSTSFCRIEYNLSLNPVVYSFFGSILLPWKLHWEHFVYFSLKLLVIANRNRTLFWQYKEMSFLMLKMIQNMPISMTFVSSESHDILFSKLILVNFFFTST